MTFLPPAPAPHIFLLTYPPSNFPLNAKKASSTTPNSGSELALARISAARVSLFSGMFYVAYTTLKRLEASTENLWTFSRMSHKRASCCCRLSQETRRPESNPEPLPDRRAHQRGARPRNRLRGLKTLVSGSAFLSFPKDNFVGPFGQTSKARRREGQCVRHGRQRLGTDGTDANLRKSGELRPPPPPPAAGAGRLGRVTQAVRAGVLLPRGPSARNRPGSPPFSPGFQLVTVSTGRVTLSALPSGLKPLCSVWRGTRLRTPVLGEAP